MADLFFNDGGKSYLLDAGAGIGSLSSAFLECCVDKSLKFDSITLDSFEIDESLCPLLRKTLDAYKSRLNLSSKIWNCDFVEVASDWVSGSMFADALPKYTHAILNPPYKKIRSNSTYRASLRRAGIETVNLYSGFVALALALSAPGGEVVAIIPRSFCNGPYYKPFREYVFKHSAIRHIHLFESRDKAFSDDNVLQENIVVHLQRGCEQDSVHVSTSSDDSFSDLETVEYPFASIVKSNDSEGFIHIPSSQYNDDSYSAVANNNLSDLGVTVSTGPVIDFRLEEHLRNMPERNTVPLLYSCHFRRGKARWPLEGKKPNAIKCNDETARWLYPNGFYCVLRRFSSKEEKRRIVASLVDPQIFPEYSMLGFENHLNVFHMKKQSLPECLAHGLVAFLNTSMIDKIFRTFSGHTQVNATDLKLLKYPKREFLEEFGSWAKARQALLQAEIDEKFEAMIEHYG